MDDSGWNKRIAPQRDDVSNTNAFIYVGSYGLSGFNPNENLSNKEKGVKRFK